MSHHNPRYPHRHHVRPKTPITIEPDNGYKGLFWLIVLGTAAAIGLGYCLSQPPLPPAPTAPVIQEPPVPISKPTPIEVAPTPTPADPVKAKAEEPKKRHKADDDEPRHHKRRHRDND